MKRSSGQVPVESFFFNIKLPVALAPNGKESEQAQSVALLIDVPLSIVMYFMIGMRTEAGADDDKSGLKHTGYELL